MMKRIFLLFSILACLVACSDNDSFSNNRSNVLSFSTDTVRLDTVFSTIGSATYTMWVYNNSGDGIRISKAYLRQGNQTGFRVNVDGSYLDNSLGSQVRDLEVRKGDSIRVFIELTAPQNMKDVAQAVEDDLMFQLESGVAQSVRLSGCAWDALIMRDWVVERDTLVESRKPIIIYGGLTVNANATLTIRKTVLYFHDKAGINVYGTLDADSVLMRGDRLDHMFDYLPYDRVSGQWGGVRFFTSSTGNVLTNTELRNGSFGIRCDSARLANDNLRLYMERCIVHNSTGHGLELYNAFVGIKDCQITNNQGDCVLTYGGAVLIEGCTIAQFYPFVASRGVALRFFNSYQGYAYPLELLSCESTILTGYADDELMGTQERADTSYNYVFDKCLLRTPSVDDTTHFKNIIWEKPTDEIQGKKHFKLIDETNLKYDFHLDSLSTAKGMGCYR
jgi:hypothetical protein